jgi:hypothetical protein
VTLREVPQKFRCPECGERFYNVYWYAERCDGKAEPVRVCGRRIVRAGGYRASCWLPAGHLGPCGR